MPSRKTPENEYKDIAHPINKEMRDMLEKAIIEQYEKEMSEEEWLFKKTGNYRAGFFSVFL